MKIIKDMHDIKNKKIYLGLDFGCDIWTKPKNTTVSLIYEMHIIAEIPFCSLAIYISRVIFSKDFVSLLVVKCM